MCQKIRQHSQKVTLTQIYHNLQLQSSFILHMLSYDKQLLICEGLREKRSTGTKHLQNKTFNGTKYLQQYSLFTTYDNENKYT